MLIGQKVQLFDGLCLGAVAISFDDTRYCIKHYMVLCYLVYIFLNATAPGQQSEKFVSKFFRSRVNYEIFG